jgi:hypothetical protein
MGIESGAAAFLSGFASTYGKETPESRALKEMAFAETPTGKKYSQYRIDTELAQRAGINEGNKKVLIQDIIGHRSLAGDETLHSDLGAYLPDRSYAQVKSFNEMIKKDTFGGFLYVKGDQDYANSEAVKYGNMEMIFKTPTGAYYGHAPKGQEIKVKKAVMDLSARINTAKNKLRKENSNMPEDELTNKAYELGFNSASLDNQTLFTDYNSTFTVSMDYIIGDMKSIFVTPDSFSSQIARIARLQAVASGPNVMSQDVRNLEVERNLFEIQFSTRALKRGIYTPQQYAKAMRKLFSPYMSKAAILGGVKQRAFMRNQLQDLKMEDRLFKILKRLYPKQNTPPKTDVPPSVGSLNLPEIQTFLGGP